MSLTKADIILAVAEGNGFSKNKASETVETLLEIVSSGISGLIQRAVGNQIEADDLK